MPALTEIRLRNAKSRERPYKLFDELGLFLLITPSANQHKGRLWRLRYRYGDAEKLLPHSAYPTVSLKRAREKRDEARRLLADGVDPCVLNGTSARIFAAPWCRWSPAIMRLSQIPGWGEYVFPLLLTLERRCRIAR